MSDKRIRILYPFVDGLAVGGSHVSAMGLIAGLDRARFDPVVLVHGSAGPVAEYFESVGLEFQTRERLPILGMSGASSTREVGPGGYVTGAFRELRRELGRIDPDIVHTNDGLMHVNWIGPTKSTGRRFIWHHRQDPAARGVNRLAPFLADRILSVSHFSKPSAPWRNINSRFQVVRSPFDFPRVVPPRDEARRAICEELGLPGDAVLVAYVGGLIGRKRPLHFVEAVAALGRAIPDRPVHGLVLGTVPRGQPDLAAEARKLAGRLGVEGAVHLMGHRSGIERYMAGIDALLVTALSEPFGRTLIEAMYVGTPVVATRHGGNPEAIEDGRTGFLVDPDDPAAFAPPVSALVGDPALFDRISQASHAEAAANYGLQTHIDAVSAVYEELVRR